MSIKVSISLGSSVLIVSAKTGNIPGQTILEKKIIKKWYLLLADSWQTSRVSVQEWGSLAICSSLQRWLGLLALWRWRAVSAGDLPLWVWKGRNRKVTGCQALSQCKCFEVQRK